MKSTTTKKRDPAKPRPFKRTGLHRIDCPACDGYAYATLASMERALELHGRLPACACGETFRPDRVELADALELPHPLLDESHERTDRKLTGQRPHAYRGHKLADGIELAARAYGEVLQLEHDATRARRVAALNRGTLSAAARAADTASIPF